MTEHDFLFLILLLINDIYITTLYYEQQFYFIPFFCKLLYITNGKQTLNEKHLKIRFVFFLSFSLWNFMKILLKLSTLFQLFSIFQQKKNSLYTSQHFVLQNAFVSALSAHTNYTNMGTFAHLQILLFFLFNFQIEIYKVFIFHVKAFLLVMNLLNDIHELDLFNIEFGVCLCATSINQLCVSLYLYYTTYYETSRHQEIVLRTTYMPTAATL